MIEGFYYLHENGSLIYKPRADAATLQDARESDLVRGTWLVRKHNRMNAWSLLVEALAAGADKGRVTTLATQWACDDKDALEYAKRAGVEITLDGDKLCATGPGFINLAESSEVGFGDTALEAMAELAKQMGYQPGEGKPTFLNLLGADVDR